MLLPALNFPLIGESQLSLEMWLSGKHSEQRRRTSAWRGKFKTLLLAPWRAPACRRGSPPLRALGGPAGGSSEPPLRAQHRPSRTGRVKPSPAALPAELKHSFPGAQLSPRAGATPTALLPERGGHQASAACCASGARRRRARGWRDPAAARWPDARVGCLLAQG